MIDIADMQGLMPVFLLFQMGIIALMLLWAYRRKKTAQTLQEQFNNSRQLVTESQGAIKSLELKNKELQYLQKNLAVSEERFRLAIKGSNDGLWDWNLLTNEVYLSPRWKAILGFNDHELPNKLETWQAYTYEKDLQPATEKVQKFINGESATYEVEFRMTHKDGSLVPVVARGFLMRDEHGKAIRIIGTHHDLSERYKQEEKLKEQVEENLSLTEEYKTLNEELHHKNNDLLAAEEELRANLEELYEKNLEVEKSEERFRYLSSLTNEGIVLHRQGVIIDLNESACKLFGYTSEQVIGQDMIDLLASDDEKEELYAAMARTEPEPFETIARDKNGTLFPVAVNSKNTYYQNQPVRVTAIRDISDRIESEQRLKESEERFRLALKGTNDGLWDWNVTSGEVYLSERWKEMLGYADHELPNEISTWRNLLHPDDVEETSKIVEQFISGKRSDYQVEFRMRHKNGKYLHILARGYMMCDTVGKVTRIIGTHQDLSHRYAIEQKLREQVDENLSLYEEYRTINEELHIKNNDLQAAEEELRANNEELFDKNKKLIESEERYRLLFNNLNEGFALHELVLNDDGQPVDYIFRDVNPVFLSRIGMKYEDIINKSAKELFPDTEKEWIDRFAKVALTGQSNQFTNYASVIDKYYQTHVFSPKKGHFAAIFEDVTENMKAEQELKASEERFKSLFEKSQSVMFVMEADTGQLVNVNAAALKFYGYSREEMLSMNIRSINTLSDKEMTEALQKAKEQGHACFSFKHLLKSGEIRDVQAYASRINYGEKQMLFSIVIDVTEAVKANAEIKKINRRFQGLESIVHYNAKSINDLIDFALNEIIGYTNSDIGLFYHYNENQNIFVLNNWTPDARLSFSSQKPIMEDLRLDCLNTAVAKKDIVIINEADEVDYPFINRDRKDAKYKSVTIPIIVNQKVEGIIWIGRVQNDYSLFDMQQVRLLLETTWILVEKEKMQEQISRSN